MLRRESVPAKPREPGWEYRRWTMLMEMEEGLKKGGLLAWVRERFGIERSQATRDLKWLEEHGDITAVVDENDRRVHRIYRTKQARSRIERKRKGLLRWNFLNGQQPLDFRKGLAAPVTTQIEAHRNDPGDAQVDQLDDLEEEQPEEQSATLAGSIEEGRVARAREQRRRQRSLINDVYRIHIPGDRWTYLQLLLPLKEWVRVRLHEQLPVATDDNGALVYRSFISPQDPALGGEDAEDPIERRTLQSGGWPARDRMIGWAAELSLQEDGSFRLATRIEDGEERPNVGLVVQADTNFYSPLIKCLPGWDGVVAVRKRGTGKETWYEPARVAGNLVAVPPLDASFDALLEELADQTTMQAALDSLAPVGFANSGGLVFVDESAEQIASAKVGRRCQRRRIAAVRREQLESAVWPVLVVVAAVDAEHVLEMAAAEDEDPVEAVGANRAHPTLGEGVRVRRLDRRADHLDAFRPEDLVERAAELRVAIMDEEPERLLITRTAWRGCAPAG